MFLLYCKANQALQRGSPTHWMQRFSLQGGVRLDLSTNGMRSTPPPSLCRCSSPIFVVHVQISQASKIQLPTISVPGHLSFPRISIRRQAVSLEMYNIMAHEIDDR